MIEVDVQLRIIQDLLNEPIVTPKGVVFKYECYEKILNAIDKVFKLRTIDIRSKASVRIHIEDLAKEIGVSPSTLTIYISNYRFTKYILDRAISPSTRLYIDTNFVKLMYEFLRIKRREKNAEKLKEWWDTDKRRSKNIN